MKKKRAVGYIFLVCLALGVIFYVSTDKGKEKNLLTNLESIKAKKTSQTDDKVVLNPKEPLLEEKGLRTGSSAKSGESARTERYFDALLDAFSQGDENQFFETAERIVGTGTAEAVQSIVDFIEDYPDTRESRIAMRALSNAPNSDAVDAEFVEILSDKEDKQLRAIALQHLMDNTTGEIIQGLNTNFPVNEGPNQRKEFRILMSSVRDAKLVSSLKEAGKHPSDPEVLVDVLTSLAAIGNDKAANAVIDIYISQALPRENSLFRIVIKEFFSKGQGGPFKDALAENLDPYLREVIEQALQS